MYEYLSIVLNIVLNNLSYILQSIFAITFIIIYIISIAHKDELQNILAAPFLVISLIYFGFIAGLFFWTFHTNQLYNDLIMFLTLIVLVFYTYYTLQVVKSTYSGPALLQVQISHSDILKLFLRNWLNEIKELPCAEDIPYDSIAKYMDKYQLLEARWQYRDILDYHLPENYKYMQNDWDTLKDLMIRLGSSSEILCNTIHTEITNQLNGAILLNSHISIGRDDDLMYFSNRIYKICISERFIYYPNDIKLTVEKQQDGSYQLMNSHVSILKNGSKEQIEKAKLELDKISDRSYLRTKYEDKITEIEDYAKNLKNKQEQLQRKIEDLITWTLLPGTSCDRLKDFKLRP